MLRSTADRTVSPVVLFDGVCNLCNGAVKFVIRRDGQGQVLFAPLQSAVAQSLLASPEVSSRARGGTLGRAATARGLQGEVGRSSTAASTDPSLASVICCDGGQVYTKSDAVLRIARYLRQPWPLLSVLRVLPRGLRNALYDIVAKRRYRWFGRRSACMVPDASLRSRFLE